MSAPKSISDEICFRASLAHAYNLRRGLDQKDVAALSEVESILKAFELEMKRIYKALDKGMCDPNWSRDLVDELVIAQSLKDEFFEVRPLYQDIDSALQQVIDRKAMLSTIDMHENKSKSESVSHARLLGVTP